MDKVNAWLSELMGTPIESRHKNASVSRFSKADLSPQAIESLRRFYRKDYEIYGSYF